MGWSIYIYIKPELQIDAKTPDTRYIKISKMPKCVKADADWHIRKGYKLSGAKNLAQNHQNLGDSRRLWLVGILIRWPMFFTKKNGKSRGIKTCLCIMWYYVCIFQDDRIYQGLSKSFIFPAVSRLNESNPGANCVGSCWGHIPYGTNTPAYLHSTKLTL